ncbi:MAG: hypothetical protein ACKVP5_02075 [Aestuariivirga sp.]
MFNIATSRNLVIAAGLASAAFAFGASAPSQAATKSFFNCQGTKFQTFRCCKEYQPKPIWFKQQALNCEGVVKCVKKYCYVKQTWYPTYESKQKHSSGGENGKGGKGSQNGPNGKTSNSGQSPN